MKNFIYDKSHFAIANFLQCIQHCLDYTIQSSVSVTESDQYMKEISEIIHFTYLNGYSHGLKKLATTGVFNDAIGKVVNVTESEIIVETDY